MKFVDYVDGGTWMEIYNEAATARDKATRYSQEDIDMTRSHQYPYRYPDIDWQDVMFKIRHGMSVLISMFPVVAQNNLLYEHTSQP